MGRAQVGARGPRRRCRGLVARARSDRGASAVELAILGFIMLFASFLIITFAMWFDARHAALAAAQEGDLVAREEIEDQALTGNWMSDATTTALNFYHGLDTRALVGLQATAKPASIQVDGNAVPEVSVTVSGQLDWFFSFTVSETVTGPDECFHTAQSGGASCP
jgi:Flp pilus assembly protein TadG